LLTGKKLNVAIVFVKVLNEATLGI
jgi:hypothetical protein